MVRKILASGRGKGEETGGLAELLFALHITGGVFKVRMSRARAALSSDGWMCYFLQWRSVLIFS